MLQSSVSYRLGKCDLSVILSLLKEIPEFLSPEECDHIITLAKGSGLRTSTSGLFSCDGDLDEDLAIAGEGAGCKKKRIFY